jgi:hypothetical protein
MVSEVILEVNLYSTDSIVYVQKIIHDTSSAQ